MGLWTSATLNRFVNIGGGDEEEDIYDYAKHVKKLTLMHQKVVK